MKPGLILFVLAAFFMASMAAVAHGVSLSDLDMEWFRENPSPLSWGPDPFIPKVSLGVTGKTLGLSDSGVSLTAVIMGGAKPAAVVNGVVVHPGGRIKGSKVVRITKNSVYLKGPGGLLEIHLKPLFKIKSSLP